MKMKLEDLLLELGDYKGDISKDLRNFTPPGIEKIIKSMNEILYGVNEKKRSMQKELTNKNESDDNQLVYFTVKDAARILQCSISTINNLMKSGELKFFKIRGSVRFTYDNLKMGFINDIKESALCTVPFISVDKKTSEVLPFERGDSYQIISENRIWISLFNQKWDSSARFSKKEFSKYFRYKSEFKLGKPQKNKLDFLIPRN